MSSNSRNNNPLTVPSLPETSQTAAAATTGEKPSYGQILKSSALIGGSSLLTILIGIVRTKAMAVLLGPAGFGLVGVYGSITNLAQTIAEMGINGSGVRQMAEAAGSGETARIAQTATVLRRISVLLGLFGASLLILFSNQVSTLTFGNDQHAGAIAMLSLVVLFGCVAGGQGALVQGMRRITDLAKMGVLGTLFGTVISIPLVYFYREQGIVLSLVGGAAMSILTSWWYSRKIQVQRPAMTVLQVRREAAGLLKLGFAFMASGMLGMGAAYAVRTIVLRMEGLDAAGFYSSAWNLGGFYVGIILQAMGADFYPRLIGVAQDNHQCNRLVNEQVQISLLLAGPGVIATLTFAPLVIALFYSTKFYQAVEVLRWICLGIALRVITWPIGFITVAKNRPTIFLSIDMAWTVVNLGLTWICVKSFGLNGTGIAFFASYVFHGLMVYPIVRKLSGFRWSNENRKIGLIFIFSIAVVFCGFYLLPPLLAYGAGTLVIILSSLYSIRLISNVITLDRIPRRLQQLLTRFGLAPSR